MEASKKTTKNLQTNQTNKVKSLQPNKTPQNYPPHTKFIPEILY